MHVPKTITSPLTRVIVFLGLFVIVSGTIGPHIISGNILFRDGFAIYGSVGKVMIFGLIAFVLLVRHNRQRLIVHPWRPLLLGWMVAAMAAFGLAWAAVDRLIAGQRDPATLLLAHGGLLICVAFVAIGCLGPANLQLLWRQFKREIMSAAGLAIGFYIFLIAVYALWQPLAWLVMAGVSWLLSASGLHPLVIPPNTLLFDKFGITIAEYCSGIESIALFTGLYVIIGLLDWHRLDKWRYFVVFPFALFVLSLLNILRVYGLIMAGYYFNPQIAFSLFHTYAGMVFFILYSGAFWAVAYRHLLQKDLRDAPQSKKGEV